MIKQSEFLKNPDVKMSELKFLLFLFFDKILVLKVSFWE